MDMDEWRRRDPQAGCACAPQAYRGSPGIVSTPYVMFSNVLLEDFTQKNLTHNQNTEAREALIHQSHSYLHEGLFSSNKAEQLLREYLDIPHISKWGGALIQTITAARPAWSHAERHFGNQTPELVIPSGPDLFSAQCLPVPRHVRPPRIRPRHLMALVASGYADCVSVFSKLHF